MRLLAPLLAVGLLLAGAAPAAALTGSQEIGFLNAQRAANGIPADITEVPAWSDGCAKHMAYLTTNHVFQHEESPSAPGYTPEGAEAGITSVLTSGGSSFSNSGVNAFEHAPIHLAQMLSPWLRQSGAANGCLVTLRDLKLNTARSFASWSTYSYPGNGAGNVAVSETARESPFVPGDFVGLPQGTKTGPHLYFFNVGPAGYWGTPGAFTGVTLSGPSGPVAVRSVDNQTTGAAGPMGRYIPPGGIVIPVAPLALNAQYTASVSFQPSGGGALVRRVWSFSTGPTPTPTPTPPTPPTPTPTTSTKPAGSTTPSTAVKPVGSTTSSTGTTSGSVTAVPRPGVASALHVRRWVLGRRSLAVRAEPATVVWVTIEQRVSKRNGPGLRWKVRRTFALTTDPARLQRITFPALAGGRYRVQLRHTDAAGALLVTKRSTLR